MKKTIIIATLILVMGITVVVQGQRDVRTRWEYANIQFDSFGTWTWKDPSLQAEGEELIDLCRELSAIKPNVTEADLTLLVNWAGGNGWEMVSMYQSPRYISVWFKR